MSIILQKYLSMIVSKISYVSNKATIKSIVMIWNDFEKLNIDINSS